MRKLLLIAGVVCGTGLQAGPITSSTALPVNTGQFIFRSQFQMTRAGNDPGPADRDLRVIAVPTALVYGVNERTALFGVLPWLDKRMELNTGPGRSTRGDAGLGDARAWLRQTIWQEDRPGETRRVAPFIGLKLPTGRSDAADSQGRLPRPLQLGSGSWDPFVGLVFTRQTLDWEFDASASYQHNTRADAFRFGDMFRADASFQKRLWPRELNAGVPAFFYGVLESTLTWQDENRAGRLRDPNSGGLTWYLTPGIQYVNRRWIAEAAIQLPTVQRLNGSGLEKDFIFSAGFRINF